MLKSQYLVLTLFLLDLLHASFITESFFCEWLELLVIGIFHCMDFISGGLRFYI